MRTRVALVAALAAALFACGPPSQRGVCVEAFLLADRELSASAPEGVRDWVEDARDLIEVSREYVAASGDDVFNGLADGLADDLRAGVQVLEASQDLEAVSLAIRILEPAMSGYLTVCEPFADSFYGGGP